MYFLRWEPTSILFLYLTNSQIRNQVLESLKLKTFAILYLEETFYRGNNLPFSFIMIAIFTGLFTFFA